MVQVLPVSKGTVRLLKLPKWTLAAQLQNMQAGLLMQRVST